MSTPGFVPRYYAIEQALRARIASSSPGDPLPSDAQLCEEFGVSRMTARNAVQRLTHEGLVTRVPGRGTFVAEPLARRRAESLVRFSAEMRRRGRRPSSRLLVRRLREPTPAEREQLRLREGEHVVAVVRVRLADDQPVAVESATIPGACAPAVLDADLERGSLHAALVAAGREPAGGRSSIAAETAGERDATLLGIAPGSALLVERRLIVDVDDNPLELTESRYAGDRYGLDVRFDVSG
jgi:GntR family transcriptional regulator